MKVIKIADAEAEIQFTYRELLGLNGALKEICYGISVPDLESKIGLKKEKILALFNFIRFDIINNMEEKSIEKLIFNRAIEIQKKLNFKFSDIKIPRLSPQVRQECYFKIGSRVVIFLLFSLKHSKRFSGIQILEVDLSNPNKIIGKSSVQKIEIFDLLMLIAYFETYMNLIKSNNKLEEFILSIYNVDKQRIFDIRVLSVNITPENKEFLRIDFRLHSDIQEEKINLDNYLAIEALGSFEDIQNFTSSIRDFLTKLPEQR